MASLDLPQSPNVFHPEKPSAVGSRNSLAQDYRDQQKEAKRLKTCQNCQNILQKAQVRVLKHFCAVHPVPFLTFSRSLL